MSKMNEFMWAVIKGKKEVVEHSLNLDIFWRVGHERPYKREDFDYLGEVLPIPDEVKVLPEWNNCANYSNIEFEITD